MEDNRSQDSPEHHEKNQGQSCHHEQFVGVFLNFQISIRSGIEEYRRARPVCRPPGRAQNLLKQDVPVGIQNTHGYYLILIWQPMADFNETGNVIMPEFLIITNCVGNRLRHQFTANPAVLLPLGSGQQIIRYRQGNADDDPDTYGKDKHFSGKLS